MVKKNKILKNIKLSKPKIKLPSYSAKDFVKNLASEKKSLVTSTDPLREKYENPQLDNRSLFFREAYKEEKRKPFGGFI